MGNCKCKIWHRVVAVLLALTFLSAYLPEDIIDLDITVSASDDEIANINSTNNDIYGNVIYSGEHKNCFWRINEEGTLYIGGDGELSPIGNGGFTESMIESIPWYNYRNEVKKVIVLDGITSLGQFAIAGMIWAEELSLPTTLRSIGFRAIASYNSLKEVDIPSSVEKIGAESFFYCSLLKKITILNNVTSISSSTFKGCSQLVINGYYDSYAETYAKENDIPFKAIEDSETSDTDIFEYTINEDDTLTITGYNGSDADIEIPNTIERRFVTSIGSHAFFNCDSLTSITIPDSVTYIGDYAFHTCDSLTNITIPNSVTYIGNYAFYSCDSLTNITIPNSVTSIGVCAFSDCDSLTSITIPNSVTSIGSSAFSDCDSLTSITIPNSVTSIGSSAFRDCDGLTSITIPDSVTSIGDGVFSYCDNLTSINVAENNANYKSLDGVLFNKEMSTITCFPNGKGVSYSIPNSVTSIGDSAFCGCTTLTNITILNSITSIGVGAFSDCDSLTSITIPNSITSIGGYAFSRCDNLTSVTIPDSVTFIGDSAFYNCDSLTIYGSVGSYAETYANENSIPFFDLNESKQDIIGNKTLTSGNGTLEYTGVFLGDSIIKNQYSVSMIRCIITDETTYSAYDIEWFSSDTSVLQINSISVYNNQSKCFYSIWNKGNVTLTAYLPNGEYIEIPFVIEDSNLTYEIKAITTHSSFTVSSYTNYYNKPIQVGFTIYPYIDNVIIIPSLSDAEQNENYYKMLELQSEMENIIKSGDKIEKLLIELPNGFLFDDNTTQDAIVPIFPMLLNERATYYSEKKVNIFIESIPENVNKKYYPFTIDLSINGEDFSAKGNITVYNADYVDTETPNNPNEPVSTASAIGAFEKKYRSHLTNNDATSSTIRTGFLKLSQVVSKDWFDKIVADTEMFCDLEMMSTQSSDGFDFNAIFGYEGLKANAWTAIGKKTLLTFNNVSNKKNTKRYTVYIQLETNAAGIGNATASYCTATAYVDVGDHKAMCCGISLISYSNLSSLNSDLKEIYNKTTHSDDYLYWIKQSIKDYSGITGLTKAGDIAEFIYDLYSNVTSPNLSEFTINPCSDIKKLFKIIQYNEDVCKKLDIHCPVDVEVLDSSNNIVGAIYDNTVEISTVAAQMYVSGDDKSVIVPLSDNYTIRLIGNDAGSMEYTVSEIVNNEVVRAVSFENLSLTNEKIYTGDIENIIFQLTEDYALTDENDKVYTADTDTHNFNLQTNNYVLTLPEQVTVTRNSEVLIDNEIIQTGDRLMISAQDSDGFVIKLNNTEISNGSEHVVSNENIIITVEYTNTDVHTHIFPTTWYFETSYHWYECECGEKSELAIHTENSGIVTVQPTATTTGEKTYSCIVCGYVTRTEIIPVLEEQHAHSFGTDWKYDKTSHWRECNCGEKTDMAVHAENNGVVTVQPTATSSGVVTYSCSICDFVTRTVTISPTGGGHTPPSISTPVYPPENPTTSIPDDEEDEEMFDDAEEDYESEEDEESIYEDFEDDDEITISLDNDLKKLTSGKANINTKKSFFDDSATICLSNTEESYNTALLAIEELSEDSPVFYAFDISIYDENQNDISDKFSGGYVTFKIPVPKSMVEMTDEISVYHIEEGYPEYLESEIVDDDGFVRVKFSATEFSPFMFIAEGSNASYENPDSYNDAENDDMFIGKDEIQINDGNANPNTNVKTAIIIPTAVIGCVLLLKKPKRKRHR